MSISSEFKTINQLLLFRSISEGNLGSVHSLVRQGVDLNEKNAGGLTPLHHAVDCSEVDILTYLVGQVPNVTIQDPEGRTFVGRIFSRLDMTDKKNLKIANVLKEKFLKAGYPKSSIEKLLKH